MGWWNSFSTSLKEKKLGQVAAVYLGTAWVLTEAFSFFAQRYQWPSWLIDLLLVGALYGLPITLLFRWYHGKLNSFQSKRALYGFSGGFVILAIASCVMVYNRQEIKVYQPLVSEKSVAVMPFTNLSQDSEQEYFSDGITEDIISKLVKIADIHVTSRTSSQMYKNTTKNIHQISTELGVAYIVEGSIRRSTSAFRVTARLVKASTDQNIWTETYDKPIEDIFELQSDLSEKIANALKVKITSGEKELIEKIPTASTNAYQYYQQGRYTLSLSGKANIENAILLFKRAIQEDSSFSLAHAGLAEAFIALVDWGYSAPAIYSDSILQPLQIALDQDPMLGEAYSALAAYHLYMHDWTDSEKAAIKAIELNPGGDFAYYHYATLSAARQQFQKSFELIAKGLSLNPLSSKFNGYKIQFYAMSGQYEMAVKEAKKLLALFPDDDFILWSMGCALAQLGEYDEAISAFYKRKADPRRTNWALAYTYAMKGEKDKAIKILAYLEEKSKNDYVPPTFIGMVYIGLEETEKAMDYIELGYKQKDNFSIFYKVHPWFSGVRENPRFKILLKQFESD